MIAKLTAKNISWIFKRFEKLTTKELYDFLALRQEVFIVEQECPYVDADGKDLDSFHLMGYKDNNLAAYARITFPGVRFKEVSIGRIVSSQKYRRQGFGKAIIAESLKRIEQEYGEVAVRLSGQTYLIDFYKQFDFEVDSEEYPEDGIPHVEMVRSS